MKKVRYRIRTIHTTFDNPWYVVERNCWLFFWKRVDKTYMGHSVTSYHPVKWMAYEAAKDDALERGVEAQIIEWSE